MINELIQNAALLISLSVVYGLFIRFRKNKIHLNQFLTGLWFGLIAIAGMNLPFIYEPGVIYDGRSIIVALSGLFGGLIPAIVTTVVAGIYRLYLGGAGIWAGLATILFCAATGVIFRKLYKNQPENLTLLHLLGIGIVVHIIMLGSQLFIPWPDGIEIIRKIWLPVLLVFPVAFSLTGLLMLSEEKQIKNLQAVREGESRYKATIYSIGDAVITTDKNGRITQMNQIAEKLTGYQETEAFLKPLNQIFNIINSKTRKPAFNPVYEVLNNKKTVGLANHTALISKSGREFQISDSAAPITDNNNELMGVVLVFRDMTNEYMMQEALKESESRYKLIADNMLDFVALHQPDGTYTYASPSVERLLGYSPLELLHSSPYKHIHPEDIERIKRESHDKALKGISDIVMQYRIKHKAGHYIWFETITKTIHDENNVVTGLQTVSRDITKRKEVQIALQQSEETFRSLFEHHNAVHLLIDPENMQIVKANRAAADFYGWSIEELVKKKITDINILSVQEVKQEIIKVKNKRNNYFEFRHRLANNQIRDVEVFSSEVIIKDKQYIHSIIHDVTDKKLLMNEILKAKEKAEESDRLKSAFLANMSHEIRTPLNGILGFTNMLADDDLPPPDKRKKFASIINQSAESLMQIINDILDISRLDTGQYVIEKKPVHINNTLKNLHSLYRKKREEKNKENIKITIKQHPKQINFKTDENRITQVFTNLLDNALKFTTRGEISFGIRELTHDSITFFVSDTGIGIKKENQYKIFDRFAQADESIAVKYGGTGLGLSIVRKIIELMQGEITVESVPGKGTSFTFTLPFEGTVADDQSDKEPRTNKTVINKKLQVLLVEDDAISRLYYREILRHAPVELIEAETGHHALELMENIEPDVILMDIRLPDISGLEVVREIRKTRPKTPIIAQSAYAMASDERDSMEAGCNDFITKPVKAGVLLEKLNKINNQ
ncbi:MAG: PAS domain S-box protein [Bacteroidota bacterium]